MQTEIEDTLGLIHAEQRAVGEQVQLPADPDTIKALRTYTRDRLGAELADGYAALLSEADGLDFNGMVLYATTQRSLPDDSGMLLGFREANDAFRKGNRRHHILYGETGDELFAQDRRDGAWCILDRGSLSVLESFPNVDVLLERVLRRAYEA